MTFTEAAIEVLRREGKPLHFKKLTEIAVRENLLDHVGKIPEETMADQLTAHCRLPRTERRVMPVQQGTFGLVEWGLEEDPAGLDGLVEIPPEGELPYRGRERHPIPSRDLARGAGRGEGRSRRREEDERRGRRFPPPAEVAYEILAGAGKPLTLVEIAATGAERLLMPDAFVRDVAALRAALAEDDRRREASGRKGLFQLDGDTVILVAQPEPGERAPVAAPAPRAAATLQDVRRTALAALRRRLRECDGPTVEHVALKLLERLGYRELKVAKRGREHVVCTARRRMGVADVRHAIRIVRSGTDAVRRDVVDARRDVGHYGAQIGVVITPGDAAREARGEASGAGQVPVLLLCGEALAEAFAEAGVGCVPVVVPEVDEAFFRAAAESAEREEAARRARREERERREPRRDEAFAAASGGEEAPARPEPREILITDAPDAVASAADDEAEPAGDLLDDEGPEADEAEDADEEGLEVEAGEPPAARAGGEGEAGAPAGERRRRRRRRRRRGGRGRAAKDAGAAAGSAPAGGEAPAAGGPQAPGAEPAAAPPREPTGGEGV